MGFQPLLEVFGFPVSNDSEEAKRHRRDRLCPYGNKVYTQFKPALDKITLSEPGQLNVFVKNLQTNLNKVRRGASTAQVSDAALDEAIDDGSDAEDMEGLS